MKPIHIMHSTLFLKMGGLESIIMDMARNVDRSTFKISVLCLSSYDDKYKEALEKIGIKVYHIKRHGTLDFSYFEKIISLLRNVKVDILHAHSGCIFNSAVCSKLAGVKTFVYTEHGLPLKDDGSPLNSGLKTRLEDKFAAWVSNRIFPVSEEIKMDMKKRFPKFMWKVHMVTNGVDTDVFKPVDDKSYRLTVRRRFNIPEKKKLIGSVGRLVPIKNYGSLIKAVAKIIEAKHDNIHLILIGDGSERNRLEAMVRERCLGSFVTFAGVQYDIHHILPAFDIFVLPSWTEGTSISLLESQSCGIPAVVTRVGGNPVIIEHGKNGYLVETGDTKNMAEKISELLADDTLRGKMGCFAMKNVIQNYSVIKMVHDYETAYLDLLQRKNHDIGVG